MPEPLAGLRVEADLAGAEERVRELDGALGRSLARPVLDVECLPSRVIRHWTSAPTSGEAVSRAHEALRRFERACAEGVRAPELTETRLLRAHAYLVGGGGVLRDGAAWVGGESPVTARFVAAPAEDVAPLVKDLVGFLARRDLPVLVQAGLAYAQLEFIHPFRDGNGRLGRWLLQVLPRRRRLVRRVMPPLGLFFVAHADRYFAAHQAFRDGDPGTWLAFFGAAAEECASTLLDRVGR
ncbi:Fic family protein [Nonomuraea endophytica]|uniref:Fic family protein n=1 Tax=Nonomuraea endophytica TaxID=714136 RepID=UPI0037C6F8AA